MVKNNWHWFNWFLSKTSMYRSGEWMKLSCLRASNSEFFCQLPLRIAHLAVAFLPATLKKGSV
jgi:hypothetical protein